MTARADIVINDGQPTPVSHTYRVSGASQNRNEYADIASSHTIQGRPTISISNRPLKNGNGNYKATVLVRIPQLVEDVTTPHSENLFAAEHMLSHVLTAKAEFIIPAISEPEDISNLLALFTNALQDGQVTSTVEDLLLPY